jgi:hypothetical protein
VDLQSEFLGFAVLVELLQVELVGGDCELELEDQLAAMTALHRCDCAAIYSLIFSFEFDG